MGVIANQTSIDERRRNLVDLLSTDSRAREAGVRLVAVFAPEHGIRGTEDRTDLPDYVDPRTGVRIYSLYRAQTTAPPDSVVRGLDAVVFDLQDVGTRTWTYVGAMVYAMRSAARHGKPFIVLDRPNPLTGFYSEGPMLDSALANADTAMPGRPARAYALHPMPLRHGLTMGEMALYYNQELGIGADLHVIPMRGWSRDLWFDRTGLPWVKPSPAIVSLQSALLYPSLVAFERTRLSVGRGTAAPFQRFGAPWMKVREVLDLLAQRPIRGIRFEAETFVPEGPTDGKYGGQRVPGIRMWITNRNQVHPSRIGANVLWALARTSPDSLGIDSLGFDLRFGDPDIRRALVSGEEDPDVLIDRELASVFEFRDRARPHFLYR
ncbi:MAG: DUF1343 domain-containing protein [Gemmatimonadaceae bacterium]